MPKLSQSRLQFECLEDRCLLSVSQALFAPEAQDARPDRDSTVSERAPEIAQQPRTVVITQDDANNSNESPIAEPDSKPPATTTTVDNAVATNNQPIADSNDSDTPNSPSNPRNDNSPLAPIDRPDADVEPDPKSTDPFLTDDRGDGDIENRQPTSTPLSTDVAVDTDENQDSTFRTSTFSVAEDGIGLTATPDSTADYVAESAAAEADPNSSEGTTTDPSQSDEVQGQAIEAGYAESEDDPSSTTADVDLKLLAAGNAAVLVELPSKVTEHAVGSLVLEMPEDAKQLLLAEATDVAALQQAIRDFLSQLEDVATSLGSLLLESGVAPWLISAAAATTAYEVLRKKSTRQEAIPGSLPPVA